MADVHVRDTETGNEYYVSEERFRNPPKKGLWERLDSGKPRTSVAKKAAAKRTAKKAASPAADSNTSGQSADSKKETA